MGTTEVEILTALVRNGVHGQEWPGKVYGVALYILNGINERFLTRNFSKIHHAEDEVIDYLEYLLQNNMLQPQRIILFLSASPCQRCSQRITMFESTARYRHGINLEMEVVFSAFYKIRRPFCDQVNPVCRVPKHLPCADDHRAQVNGLRKLSQTPGVVLRTIHEEDWVVLRNVLGVWNMSFHIREEEDYFLRKDFEQLMEFASISASVKDLVKSSFFKGTQASLQPETGPLHEPSGEGRHQEMESSSTVTGTSQLQNVQTALQDLLLECERTQVVHTTSQDLLAQWELKQKVTCQDAGTQTATSDTETVETGLGGTGRVVVDVVEKRKLDKETQTEKLQNYQFTSQKMEAEKETQSEQVQSHEVTLEKEKLDMQLELIELTMQSVRRQHELEVEILQSKRERSRLKYIKLYYEIRKLERDLGVPEKLGVNTWLTSDTLFKVND